jgi:hypothetical protein
MSFNKQITISQIHRKGESIKGVQGDYVAEIINNSYGELINRTVGALINVCVDENGEVYVYSYASPSLKEIKVKFDSIQEASKYFTCKKRIDTDVKKLYLTKTQINGKPNK